MKHAYEKILIETLNIIIEIKIALRLIFCDSENPLVSHWSHESALHYFWGTKTLHFERSPPITKSFLCFCFFLLDRDFHIFSIDVSKLSFAEILGEKVTSLQGGGLSQGLRKKNMEKQTTVTLHGSPENPATLEEGSPALETIIFRFYAKLWGCKGLKIKNEALIMKEIRKQKTQQ